MWTRTHRSCKRYYAEQAENGAEVSVKEETIIHQFKDSRDHYGYGYFVPYPNTIGAIVK